MTQVSDDIDNKVQRVSKRIIYVHVPKAGGTSIWEMLSSSFGPNQTQNCALDSLTDPRTLIYVDPARWNLDADNYAHRLPPNLRYIQGHFPATRFYGRTEAFFLHGCDIRINERCLTIFFGASYRQKSITCMTILSRTICRLSVLLNCH